MCMGAEHHLFYVYGYMSVHHVDAVSIETASLKKVSFSFFITFLFILCVWVQNTIYFMCMVVCLCTMWM